MISAVAYAMADYSDAKRALGLLHRELMDLNPSAARSLEEGMEETLTVHKLRENMRKMRQAAKDQQDVQDQLVEGRDKRIKELQRAAKLGDKYDGMAAELIGDIGREAAILSAAARTLIERVAQFGQLDNTTEDQIEMVQSVVNNARAATSELEGLV